MTISGSAETLVEVGATGEMNLEDTIFQGVVGFKVEVGESYQLRGRRGQRGGPSQSSATAYFMWLDEFFGGKF